MGGENLGGGLVIVVAAVLWLAFLVPGWWQRREYLANERNVIRLQQSLRILAESSEVPDEVRVEVNAREVLAKEKLVRAMNRRRRAETLAELKAVKASISRPLALRRRRRGRLATSCVLFVALVATGLGVLQVLTGAGFVILTLALVLVAASVVALVRLARPLPRPEQLAPAVKRGRSLGGAGSATDADALESTASPTQPLRDRSWTPRALPRPLYLGEAGVASAGGLDLPGAGAGVRTGVASASGVGARGSATVEAVLGDQGASTVEVAEGVQAAETPASASEQQLRHDLEEAKREAAAAHELAAQALAAAQEATKRGVSAKPSPYAAMGRVGDDTTPVIDLNEVLAKRRAV